VRKRALAGLFGTDERGDKGKPGQTESIRGTGGFNSDGKAAARESTGARDLKDSSLGKKDYKWKEKKKGLKQTEKDPEGSGR